MNNSIGEGDDVSDLTATSNEGALHITATDIPSSMIAVILWCATTQP
jgi:hypothetical protein